MLGLGLLSGESSLRNPAPPGQLTQIVISPTDPINSPVKDEAAMNVLRLESRVAGVVDYLARLKVAASRIDTTL